MSGSSNLFGLSHYHAGLADIPTPVGSKEVPATSANAQCGPFLSPLINVMICIDISIV